MITLQRILTFGVLLSGLMLLSACEDGSYFDADTVQMKSDFVSRIETVGEDMRVYEFTPRSDPSKQCVMVVGTGKGGLVCWDKT